MAVLANLQQGSLGVNVITTLVITTLNMNLLKISIAVALLLVLVLLVIIVMGEFVCLPAHSRENGIMIER